MAGDVRRGLPVVRSAVIGMNVDIVFRSFPRLDEGDIDLASAIERVLPYKELRDPNRFIQFGLVGGTLVWSDDLDMAPDWLYEEMLKQNNKIIQ